MDNPASLAFIDTETTSLRPDRRAWEIGLIVRDTVTVKHPNSPDTREPRQTAHLFYVDIQDLDLGNADLFALNVGRFYERHPEMRYANEVEKMMAGDVSKSRSEYAVMQDIERLTRGAHLVGAVVSFDADVLSTRMRAHGILPSWHYHLIDIEPLALGYQRGQLSRERDPTFPDDVHGPAVPLLGVPWRSDQLTEALGVKPSPDDDRHTAIGDAMWAMRMYDKVMGTEGF
jgi:DNA polymerase III epsilon subunit-like protein